MKNGKNTGTCNFPHHSMVDYCICYCLSLGGLGICSACNKKDGRNKDGYWIIWGCIQQMLKYFIIIIILSSTFLQDIKGTDGFFSTAWGNGRFKNKWWWYIDIHLITMSHIQLRCWLVSVRSLHTHPLWFTLICDHLWCSKGHCQFLRQEPRC